MKVGDSSLGDFYLCILYAVLTVRLSRPQFVE